MVGIIKKLYCISLIATLLSGCREKEDVKTLIEGVTQGSPYRIVMAGKHTDTRMAQQIDSIFNAIENSMSLYRPGSLIVKINNNETDSIDRHIHACLEIARQLYDESDGAFDVTVKPLVAALGFSAEERSEHYSIDSIMQFVGFDRIAYTENRISKSDPRVQIDLNAIASGYAVDVVRDFLDANGIGSYIVEVGGGELFARGTKPDGTEWVVGIDRPTEGNMTPGADLIAQLPLKDRGMATSGNYRKFYTTADGQKVTHTIDAKAGRPVVHNLLSATVSAPTSGLADGFGTVMMIVGMEKSLELLGRHPELDAYLIYSDSLGNFKGYYSTKQRYGQ